MTQSKWFWWGVVAACLVILVLMGLICKRPSCAKGVIEQVAEEVGGMLSGPEKPAEPVILPPKQKTEPSGKRRPWIGTEGTEGTEIEITRPESDSSDGSDTLRIHVGRNGTVTNLGEDTLEIKVTKVLKPWVQWDPGAGFCVLAGAGRREISIVREWQGMHLDLALQGKLLDFPVFQTGFEVGLPVVYVASSGVGIGVNLKHDVAEWFTIGAGWFWPEEEVQVGIGVSF